MTAKQSRIVSGVVASGLAALSAVSLHAAATLTTSPAANGNLVIGWDSRGALEQANQASGPWATITNAPNPYATPVTNSVRFFRLNQTVAATSANWMKRSIFFWSFTGIHSPMSSLPLPINARHCACFPRS